MKQIKTPTAVILIFLSISMYAQSKDSLSIKHNMSKFSGLTTDNNNSYFKYTQKIKKISFQTKEYQFIIYNKATGLNDNYFITKNGFSFIYSNKLLENNFGLQKIDSFNPYGSPDLSTAVINGLLHSISIKF